MQPILRQESMLVYQEKTTLKRQPKTNLLCLASFFRFSQSSERRKSGLRSFLACLSQLTLRISKNSASWAGKGWQVRIFRR